MLEYFLDPVLRAPTLGCMLMCLGAALVGVVVFLRKQSLIGEALSHASYPGVIAGILVAGLLGFDTQQELRIALLVMGGAMATALLGLWCIHILERKWKVRSDSALCFILAAFFGIGLTLASDVQFSYTSLYRQAIIYLYGQAATMTDLHIIIYGALALAIVALVALFHKELQAITFDRDYAKTLGISVAPLDTLLFILIALSIVVGIRSVGVVLISAMLIAPAAAARQYTHKFSTMLILAALFGLLSGFLGNYLSVEISRAVTVLYPGNRFALPTGPMIVLVASCLCVLSLLLAPERGRLWRMRRASRFRSQVLRENLLKAMWRFGDTEVPLNYLKSCQTISSWGFRMLLKRLVTSGWVERMNQKSVKLTAEGCLWAARVVRLHRLWEVYLVDYLGMGVERVHYNAEEMEHILTPELEKELTLLLNDPKRDPHHQPIPPAQSKGSDEQPL
ncbi:MAG: metal ABC transporter permease [Parachlamydia sp.]|nr:metal ABC transporter permease [Parachlamydia sp.]